MFDFLTAAGEGIDVVSVSVIVSADFFTNFALRRRFRAAANLGARAEGSSLAVGAGPTCPPFNPRLLPAEKRRADMGAVFLRNVVRRRGCAGATVAATATATAGFVTAVGFWPTVTSEGAPPVWPNTCRSAGGLTVDGPAGSTTKDVGCEGRGDGSRLEERTVGTGPPFCC